jgi:predicted nucleic acid-binding protein
VRRYVIDTDLYVEATRNDGAAEALKEFYARSLPRVYLHSVVAQELLAGTDNPSLERLTYTLFIEPFEGARRVFTPSHTSWKRAGEVMARLVRDRKLSPGGFKRSFVNDCVLAASAREHGFVIVTRNTEDFELIRTVEAFETREPWPADR